MSNISRVLITVFSRKSLQLQFFNLCSEEKKMRDSGLSRLIFLNHFAQPRVDTISEATGESRNMWKRFAKTTLDLVTQKPFLR